MSAENAAATITPIRVFSDEEALAWLAAQPSMISSAYGVGCQEWRDSNPQLPVLEVEANTGASERPDGGAVFGNEAHPALGLWTQCGQATFLHSVQSP